MFGNVSEGWESRCCGALMRRRRKVKGEQVITLQIARQLKAQDNYFAVSVKLYFS